MEKTQKRRMLLLDCEKSSDDSEVMKKNQALQEMDAAAAYFFNDDIAFSSAEKQHLVVAEARHVPTVKLRSEVIIACVKVFICKKLSKSYNLYFIFLVPLSTIEKKGAFLLPKIEFSPSNPNSEKIIASFKVLS